MQDVKMCEVFAADNCIPGSQVALPSFVEGWRATTTSGSKVTPTSKHSEKACNARVNSNTQAFQCLYALLPENNRLALNLHFVLRQQPKL
jgi:hypothetical protein